MKKRLLALIMVLSLALSLVPVGAVDAVSGANEQITSVSTGSESPVQITKTLTGDGSATDPYKLQLEAYVTGQVSAPTTKPLDIVLVIDQSGSMAYDEDGHETYQYNERRIAQLKTALDAFIDQIQENAETNDVDHRIAIVGFASDNDAGDSWDTTGAAITEGSSDSYYVNTGLYIDGVMKNYETKGTDGHYSEVYDSDRDPLDTAETYWIHSGRSYIEVSYSTSQNSWGYYSYGRWQEVTPKTSREDTAHRHTQFYEYIPGTEGEALTAEDYKDALVSANVSGRVNSDLSTAVNNMEASGGTYTWYGMEMAKNVFDNNDSSGRERVVVVFSDGETNSDPSDVLDQANDLKASYDATIYTVAFGDSASLLEHVSSDYESAWYRNGRYDGNHPDNWWMNDYSLEVSRNTDWSDIFTTIAGDITSSVDADAASVLTDTLFEYFAFGDLGENNGNVTVQVYNATGYDSSAPSWKWARNENNVTVSVAGKTINISGFDYSSYPVVYDTEEHSWTGQKLVISFPIQIDSNATFNESGLYDTNNTTDTKAGLKNDEGYFDNAELNDSPNVYVGVHKVTYEWTGDNIPEDEELPAAITGLVNGQSYTVDSTYHAGYTVNSEDEYGNVNGTYTFSGWKLNDAVVTGEQKMGDADVTLIGEWTYEEQAVATHKVTYDWGTENVPNGVTLPEDETSYVKGQPYEVDDTYTSETTVNSYDENGNMNGVYTFSGWTDPNNGTMGEADVIIDGSWNWSPASMTVDKVLTSINGEAVNDNGNVQVSAEDVLGYKITVTNTGEIPLANIQVTDSLWGNGVTSVSVNEGEAQPITSDGFIIPVLGVGDNYTFEYTYTVPADYEGDTLTNVARAEDPDGPGGGDEVTVWTKGVSIQPAAITLYTGGTGYSGIVGNENGNTVEDAESTGLPEPGYYIELPQTLNNAILDALGEQPGTVIDLSKYVEFTYDDNNETTRTWALERYDRGGDSTVSDGRYIYRLCTTAPEQPAVRLAITGDTVDGMVTSDEFDINLNQNLYREYTMSIYAGDLDQGLVKLTVKDDAGLGELDGQSYSVEVEPGTLTIRGVTGEEETAVVGSQTESGFRASVPDGTTYNINESAIGVNDPSNIQLLVDEIVAEGTDAEEVTNALVNNVQEALAADGISLDSPAYDMQYLDLVDGNNGNVYVTASNDVTITWPMPTDAAKDTNFHVVHFDGLDREFSGEDAVREINDCNPEVLEASVVDGAIQFTTDSFSPFVLVYDTNADAAPGLDVEKTLTAVNEENPGSSVSVGDTLTYTITVTNTGNVDLTNVTVTDTMSNGRTVNWVNLPEGVTENADGTLTIASLPTGGDPVTLTANYVVLRIDANSNLSNTVKVTGQTPDGGTTEDETTTPPTPVDPITPIRPPVDPDKPELNTEDHYAYIVGYPDGNVKPEGNITRAEVATIFFRLLTDESRDEFWSQTNPYSDVSEDDWYNNAVSTLTNAGIIDGYEDGTFKPNGNITRAEFATIAVRFFEATYEGENLFPDIDGHWAQDYINEAANAGIVDGYPDGTFQPQQLITRAEAMTMVNRTIDRHPDADHLLDDMITWPDNPETAWYYEQVQEATNSHEYTMNTDDEQNPYEIWTELLPVRDWAQLEKEWSDAHSGQSGGDVV